MARDFNGTTDYVDLGNTGVYNTKPAGDLGFYSTDDYTVRISYKGTDTTTNGDWGTGLLSRDDGDFHGNIVLRTGFFELLRIDAGWEHNIISANDLSDDAWHDMIIVNDGATQTADLWVDGVQDVTGGDSEIKTGGTVYIKFDTVGRSYNSVFTAGKTAEVTIWNIKLTAGQVTGLMNGVNAFPVMYNNQDLNLPLYGNDSSTPDYSGNGNIGTITGTTKASTHPPMELMENYL